MVREGGVEPPRPHGHTDLNRARLPIPPLALCHRTPHFTGATATSQLYRTALGSSQTERAMAPVVSATLKLIERPQTPS